MESENNTKRLASGQQKRRACDECRGRKLACSKELEGCARCKREGIQCVYSPQKQMGRPRKRAHVENTPPETRKDEQPVQQKPLPPQPPAVSISPQTFVMPDFDVTMGMDLEMSFLDMNNADINFFDLLEPGADFAFTQDCSTAPPPEPATFTFPPSSSSSSSSSPSNQPPPSAPAACPTNYNPSAGFWPIGTQIANIDFNANPYQLAPPEPNPEFTHEDVTNLIANELAEYNDYLTANDRVPSLSPGSSPGGPSPPSSSSEAPTSHPSPDSSSNPAPSCSCLASLYLALENLKTISNVSVTQAMRITRASSRAAHDCVLCPVCGNLPLPLASDDLTNPPISAIQSMMMLGAILPSLSNAYMQILTMVDNETAAAEKARRRIQFTLNEYGGVWGVLQDQEPYPCDAADKLEGAVLEPQLWRLTVRSLLKLDVYGIEESRRVVCKDMRHVGLKDIIGMMEERSRNRHEMLDELIAAGQIKAGPGYVPLGGKGENGEENKSGWGWGGAKPTCLSIIDVAKRSMADLVIP
ncbi:hypothetical protein QBC38DRAFT_469102 [Podospora fimiseda]|uniref:Zn(2)-C6 fungal-type domain-containing protein n=1 Tax=Podospora fimiseda TaxID=252190 RepID=A0AAN7BVT7_9PEZI|nr:hypothetical protein QBC38DRAFT_469102 [Podospora fimiseda]